MSGVGGNRERSDVRHIKESSSGFGHVLGEVEKYFRW